MSGSTDASTIAERTKLEAQLRQEKESLNDTYYSHGMESMIAALDNEMEAFEKTHNDYLEELRESIKDTDSLITTTLNNLLGNADIVLDTINEKADEYGILIDSNLTRPWESASTTSLKFKASATRHIKNIYDYVDENAGDLEKRLGDPYANLNYDHDGNPLYQFSRYALKQIDTIIEQAEEKQEKVQNAVDDGFEKAQSSIGLAMSDASESVDSLLGKFTDPQTGLIATLQDTTDAALEAADAISKMATYYNDYSNASTDTSKSSFTQQAIDETAKKETKSESTSSNNTTQKATPSTPATPTPTPSQPSGGGSTDVKNLQKILNKFFSAGLSVDGLYGPATKAAVTNMQNALKKTNFGGHIGKSDGLFGKNTKEALQKYLNSQQGVSQWFKSAGVSIPAAMYAKGTLGTKRDEWAITDESWIGEEITLAAGKNGQLQYLKKGSAVMPADISANLVEWGKLNPTMMSIGDMSGGIQMMSNYVNKPEIKLDIENFLNVGAVSKDTLPELERLMDKKIDTFAKQLNASIRKFK